MRVNTKLPEGLGGIAELMEMDKDEVRAWPYFEEVRNAMKDFNLRVLTKGSLIERLYNISAKCASAEEEMHHYSEGIDNAISTIKSCY